MMTKIYAGFPPGGAGGLRKSVEFILPPLDPVGVALQETFDIERRRCNNAQGSVRPHLEAGGAHPFADNGHISGGAFLLSPFHAGNTCMSG